MNISDYFHDRSVMVIATGYKMGGYEKLREEYPERLDGINKELESNFCKEGIDKYTKSMIAGLKKVGYWND